MRPTSPPVEPFSLLVVASLMRRLLGLVWGLGLLLLALPLQAQEPLAEDEVPEALRPWVGWVLDGDWSHRCAWLGSRRECAWPGRLTLDLADTGGRFGLEVVAGDAVDVRLPGGDGVFPLAVTVDGRPRPLFRVDDIPHVRVEAGAHRIEGRFEVDALPELLVVPQEVALVTLRLNGEPAPVRRNDGGDLWLRSGAATPDDEEGFGLQLEVYRQLRDRTPFEVHTRIALRASGEAREVSLGSVLLEGTTPTAITSVLAARLDPETGELRVQTRPGTFEIDVVARVGTSPEALVAPELPEPWPARETWVWYPDEALRQVDVSGAPAIDQARADLPDGWRPGSIYALQPGQTLTLRTTRRGDATPEPNDLALSRQLWLDFDGRGYTVRDQLRGAMNRDFRLDLEEGELGRVELLGADQVITEVDGSRGVEVRSRRLEMTADLRLPDARTSLAAVGWSDDVSSLDATLNLPPGWLLMTASGVDEVTGTWLDQWTLWSIFFVLVIALAIARLGNVWLGLLALVTLTLGYHEPGAPFIAWMLFVPLLALRRVVPEGTAQRVVSGAFWVSVIVLVWVSVPFATGQLRTALYPFLAESSGSWVPGGGRSAATLQHGGAEVVAPEWLEAEESMDDVGGGRGKRYRGTEGAMPGVSSGETSSSSSTSRSSDLLNYYGLEPPADAPEPSMAREQASVAAGWVDPNAIAQTGPGVPTWSFHQHELRWNGPVRSDHRIGLWLMPPWMFRLLALLRVVALAALLALLLTRLPAPPAPKPREDDEPPGPAAPVAPAAALMVLLLGLAPGTAEAQDPLKLTELQTRLQRAPECGDECVLVTDARIAPSGARLEIELEVHALSQSAVRLPGPAPRWVPEEVRVDGRPATAIRRDADNWLLLRVDEGVHRVVLSGPLGLAALTLGLGQRPARVRAESDDWGVEGIGADGTADAVELVRRNRLEPDGLAEEDAEDQVLPTWLAVRRRLTLGVQWIMDTEVRPLDSAAHGVLLRLPLLPGESVNAANVAVADGAVSVTVRGNQPVSWTSTLEPTDELVLRAAEGKRASEEWVLVCSPMWRCDTEGIDPYALGRGEVRTEFHPWPGEELTLHASRPAAAEGSELTLERADLRLTPGVRLLAARLEVDVRASQGGSQTIQLPEGAEVQSLTVAGARRPIQMTEGALRFNVPPGASTVHLEWQQPGGVEVFFRTPEVELGSQAVNARVAIDWPEDRWILWAHGPESGVAVLFWPYLLLVLGLAVFLGRSDRTPLGVGQWFLLGIGLTQIPAFSALIVVGWFFLIDLRGKRPDIPHTWFLLRQIALALYTFVAAACLYAALHIGLLMRPDMQIVSLEGGTNALAWYLDRTNETLPTAGVWSVPLWVWRIAMLLWALWLAIRLGSWGKWGWTNFAEGGWLTGGIGPVAAAKQPGGLAVAAGPEAGRAPAGASVPPTEEGADEPG